MKSLWRKVKKFYKTSPENRLSFFNILGFFVIPVIGMALLYFIVQIFWMK